VLILDKDAAVIGKEDKEWLHQRRNCIVDLVRDVANGSNSDPYFTITRCKDWFTGHSWASGLMEFGDAKNQESTSEAVNAYYGIYLLGDVLQNQDIYDLGRIMLATEIRSSQKYWQISSDSDIYDKPFSDNKVVGVLWSSKVDYATFFGSNIEFIHCIQMLPFTPITVELLNAKWIKEEYPVVSMALSRSNPPISEGWKGFIYLAHSLIDKESAIF